MNNLAALEKHYKKFSSDLAQWLPEGIIHVDISLLHRLNLLNYHHLDRYDPALTRYFQAIETHEKITLLNEEFVVWIVPEHVGSLSITYTLIATNPDENPHLEMAFATSGVYNTSRLVLRILEKYLHEIHENEEALRELKKQLEAE